MPVRLVAIAATLQGVAARLGVSRPLRRRGSQPFRTDEHAGAGAVVPGNRQGREPVRRISR